MSHKETDALRTLAADKFAADPALQYVVVEVTPKQVAALGQDGEVGDAFVPTLIYGDKEMALLAGSQWAIVARGNLRTPFVLLVPRMLAVPAPDQFQANALWNMTEVANGLGMQVAEYCDLEPEFMGPVFSMRRFATGWFPIPVFSPFELRAATQAAN
jgi:hypothetical protein